MKRRTLLQIAAPSSFGLLAGCTGVAPGDDPTDRSGPHSTGEPSPTSTPCSTGVISTSFTVTNTECGSGEQTAGASVDPTGDATPDEDGEHPTYTVTVTGTIVGSDACHSAKLAAVEPVPENDTLRVAVEAYVPESKQGSPCADCVVDVDYEATVELSCGYYGVVGVVHDGSQVTEVGLPE